MFRRIDSQALSIHLGDFKWFHIFSPFRLKNWGMCVKPGVMHIFICVIEY
jgi:hypothetical protein